MGLPMDKNGTSLIDNRIKGNLPSDIKQKVHTVLSEIMTRPAVFGAAIGERVVITEASVVPKAEESSRTEVRVVCEVTVEEGTPPLCLVFLPPPPPFFFFPSVQGATSDGCGIRLGLYIQTCSTLEEACMVPALPS
jgi:hypothetical protein